MSKIKVSIIVPVYNVEKYIGKCLDSLVNQTLKDIEVIVVNDGTKDNSEAIIKEYVKKYPSIIKYYKKENGGLSSARNYGIEKSIGEYIGFVDSDDYVELDMYEKLYDKGIKTHSDVVCSQIAYCYNKYTEIRKFKNLKYFGKNISTEPKLLLEVKSYAWNKIYKRELWNDFKFPNQYYEDSAIIYNVLYKANKIEGVDLPLYNYIKERSEAITNEVSLKIYDIFKSCDSILMFYKSQKNYLKMKYIIEGLCINHLKIRLLYLYNSKKRDITWKFYRDCIKYLNDNIPNWRKNNCLEYVKHDRLYNYKNMVIKCPGFFKIASIYPYKLSSKVLKFCKKPFRLVKRYLNNHSTKSLDEKRKYIQKNGYVVLEETLNLLNSIPNVRGFADFGTMLGIVRENGLLKHDLDMDIGVLGPVGINATVSMILKRNGYQLWRDYTYNGIIVEQSYHYKNIKIDINYYQVNDNTVNTWLFYRNPERKYHGNYRNVVIMNYSMIDKLKKVAVKGKKILIPANANQILEEKYGKTWKIPDKKWIYWKSPAATKLEGYGYYIEYKYPNK